MNLIRNVKAFVYCLLAIVSAVWLVLYTIIHDFAVAESLDFMSLVEPVKLFVPTLVFLIAGWRYLRIRRSMDKEKIKKLEEALTLQSRCVPDTTARARILPTSAL